MIEEDKKTYQSIIKKIMNGKKDDITMEENAWLQRNPSMLSLTKKTLAKMEIMKHHKDCKDTIEEILFILDLSDRLIR